MSNINILKYQVIECVFSNGLRGLAYKTTDFDSEYNYGYDFHPFPCSKCHMYCHWHFIFQFLTVGIKKKSKVPGVMITQFIETLPEGKSHPDFTRKPIALTIQEGMFHSKKIIILNINIQGKNIPRKYVILLNGLDQFNLPKEKVSAFQKQEACVSRIAKPWLNICRSDNVTKSTLHNTNDLFASVMWMH